MAVHLYSGGTILDATGAAPKPGHALLVEGNRIARIGPEAAVKAYADHNHPGYVAIDARGTTVMPGLIDVHVHISYGDITSAEELNIYTSAEYRTLRGALNLKKVLRAGVTAICDPGGTWRVSTALRDAVNSGLIEGPRMVAASQYLSTYNGIGGVFPVWVEQPPSAFSVLCNSRDDMVAEVRRQVRDGVDIIKVAGDGDIHRNTDVSYGSLTPEDLEAIAGMTHRLGKRCTIHARGNRAAREALEAGFDWIIHASYVTDDTIGAFVERRTPINPTLSLLANIVEWGPDLGASVAVVEHMKRELEAVHTNLSKAYRAGVPIMAGTDSGQSSVPYGEWHARELEHLMRYMDMSAMDAILAGTKNAAFALNLADQIGTLEVGKLADVLVVRGDPLADIAILQDKRNIVHVMKDGVLIDRTTPLPEPRVYRWEKPQRIWTDSRTATQEFVRTEATSKPHWMREGGGAVHRLYDAKR